MKQAVSFIQKFYWQFMGIFAGFAVILLWGCWFTRTQENSNLFYTYLSIYPMFFVLLPMTFSMSMRYYLELCLSFGAVRKDVFRVLQLLSHGTLFVMLFICLGLEYASHLLLPADKIWGIYALLSPNILRISFLFSMAMLQGGICLGRVKLTKMYALVMGVCIGLFGAFIGATSAMASDAIYLPFLDSASPWYWCLCGAFVLAIVGLFLLAQRLYRKATVTV